MTTLTIKQRWNAYLNAYGATDEAKRQNLLDQSVSDDVVFTNPGGDGKSRQKLSDHIGKFQIDMAGMYFTTDKLYPQTDKLLAVWSMYKKDGTKLATGYNFVQTAQDGRFSYMAGFV